MGSRGDSSRAWKAGVAGAVRMSEVFRHEEVG